MLKLLKNIFSNEKQIMNKEMNIDEIGPWLDEKISKHQFNNFIKEYILKVNQLKLEIFEKNKNLEIQEIPKKHKVVESRVQNMVKGHKEHYVREIFQFLKKCEIESQSDFSKSVLFNNDLNEMMDELAKKTTKSYEATQYLFSEYCDPIFKSICKLNTLTKKFSQQTNKLKINEILKIRELITQLNEINKNKKDITSLKIQNHEKKELLEKAIKRKKEELLSLKESEELKKMAVLQEKEKSLQNELQELDQKIHSFFSKFQKPLRKYGHIMQENKTLQNYIKDHISTFKEDLELEILNIFKSLGDNLTSLGLDEKQEKNIAELIKSTDVTRLRKWHKKVKEIKIEKDVFKESMKNINIETQIKKIHTEIQKLQEKTITNIEESTRLNSMLKKMKEVTIKNDIIIKTKESLKIKLVITS